MPCTGFPSPSSRRIARCLLVLSLAWIPVVACARADDMTSTLIIGGSRIDVTIQSGEWKLSQADLVHWVQMAGEAVATYYGRFPVPHLELRIAPFDGPRGIARNDVGTRWRRIDQDRCRNANDTRRASTRLDVDSRDGAPSVSIDGRRAPLDRRRDCDICRANRSHTGWANDRATNVDGFSARHA